MTAPEISCDRARTARRRSAAFTLMEMMMALGVFGLATLGIWECIRTTFLLSAKNTGLNLSHTSLQLPMDQLAVQLRSCLQVIDVATFDGTTFTDLNEATAASASTAGNAVRFLRVLPVSLFVLPDDASGYTETNAQNPYGAGYPDYLAAGNKQVKVTYTSQTTNLANSDFKKDLLHARFCPRFPYLTESVTTGTDQGTKPGLALSSAPALTSSPETLNLTNGLPSTAKTVPSCNQAYLVIESAAVAINRGTSYAELIYYPDANDLTRSKSLTTGLAVSTTGSGPSVFALLKTAGALNDPTARGSLCITLPVYAGNLNNVLLRDGGAGALTMMSLTLPVETRRIAQF